MSLRIYASAQKLGDAEDLDLEALVEAGGRDEATQALLGSGVDVARLWWARRESRRLMVAGEAQLCVVEDVLRRAGVGFETTR